MKVEPTIGTAKRNSVIVALGTLIPYGIFNAMFVFLPFIPGAFTFFFWVFALPALFVVGSWIYLARNRRPGKWWWIAGGACSVIYAALGLMSFIFIAEIWASV